MELLSDDVLVETTALDRAEEFIASIEPYPDTFDGRGIVICAGGETYFTNAWICIALLRHVGCRLPIQLWYLGPSELDAHMEGLVAPFLVQCVDATALRAVHPARILNGWELKPYAILHSPFREVLLLDADNFVAANPEYLFESPQYRETGALFWPDQGRMRFDSPIWNIFGVGYADEPEFESGQIVVDKARCWKALCLTKYYNDYSDFYYRYVYGDKETFHLAFRKAGQAYAVPIQPTRLRDGTFFQHDFAGKLIFQHRNGAKWSLRDDNPHVPAFHFEDDCRRFLEQLKSCWDGSVGEGSASPRETLAASRLQLTETVYRVTREGHGHWPMSFMADGRVGIGSSPLERTWAVKPAALAIGEVLEIGANGAVAHVLTRRGSSWRSADGAFELAPIPSSDDASLSLDAFVERIAASADPGMWQTVRANPGYGWMYYGLARNLRPDVAIVIGSTREFVPLCLAHAFRHNGHGEVLFVEPGYRGTGDPEWTGRGHWEYETEVRKWFDLFGLGGWIRHLKTRADDALKAVHQAVAGKDVGIVVIDGARTYEQSLRDFDNYAPLVSSGVVLFHDSTSPNGGVSRTMRDLRTRGLDVATLPLDGGLSVVPVHRPSRSRAVP